MNRGAQKRRTLQPDNILWSMSFNGVHSITQIKWLWAMIPFTLHLRMHLTVIKCSVMRSGGYYVSVLEDVLQCEQSSGLEFPVWSRDTTPRTICSLNAPNMCSGGFPSENSRKLINSSISQKLTELVRCSQLQHVCRLALKKYHRDLRDLRRQMSS